MPRSFLVFRSLLLRSSRRGAALAELHPVSYTHLLLLGLQGELVTADVTDRALGGGNIAFVNVTANRTYPLLHDRILHNLS